MKTYRSRAAKDKHESIELSKRGMIAKGRRATILLSGILLVRLVLSEQEAILDLLRNFTRAIAVMGIVVFALTHSWPRARRDDQ